MAIQQEHPTLLANKFNHRNSLKIIRKFQLIFLNLSLRFDFLIKTSYNHFYPKKRGRSHMLIFLYNVKKVITHTHKLCLARM